MSSLIHHTFGPHVSAQFALQSLGLLCTPWRWRKGKSVAKLKETLQLWFDAPCVLFGSGRDALLALLRSLPFESGSEIIIQGYTCVALPNAIHAAGFTPVFVDIDPDTLNIDHSALEGKISPRTKAIITQHTFGMMDDTQKLREICDRHNLVLIEDCAHVLPDVTGPKSIGKWSDYLMLSFGRDKAVSGITGGAIVARGSEDVLTALKDEEGRARHMRLFMVKKLLLYPLLYYIARPLYGIGIGKAMLWCSGKLHILPSVLTGKEKCGYQSAVLRKMPNACCALVVTQMRRFHSINNHRRMLTKYYMDSAVEHGWEIPSHINEHFPLQKFPLFTKEPDSVRKILKKKNIYLEDGWTGSAVCPRNVHIEAVGYIPGSCPRAERVARTILTLPTHPTMTMSQAEKLTKILSEVL